MISFSCSSQNWDKTFTFRFTTKTSSAYTTALLHGKFKYINFLSHDQMYQVQSFKSLRFQSNSSKIGHGGLSFPDSLASLSSRAKFAMQLLLNKNIAQYTPNTISFREEQNHGCKKFSSFLQTSI